MADDDVTVEIPESSDPDTPHDWRKFSSPDATEPTEGQAFAEPTGYTGSLPPNSWPTYAIVFGLLLAAFATETVSFFAPQAQGGILLWSTDTMNNVTTDIRLFGVLLFAAGYLERFLRVKEIRR